MGPGTGRKDGETSARPRVLVVDDSRLGRKLTAIRLDLAGFTVEVAATAEEALSLAATWSPDAVLSDVRMPGMDGFELCRTLRADTRLARTPVVLLSAEVAGAKDRERLRAAGASALVLRSPDLHEAIEALSAVLRRSG